MISIRPREETDLDKLITVLQIVHADSGYPVLGTSNANEFIRGKDTLQAWVAEVNGKVIGHCLVGEPDRASPAVALWQDQGREQKAAVFNRLFVDPGCRGQGVAKQLCEVALQYAEEHSLRLLLYVLEEFPTARKLYDRLSWEHYGDSVFEYGDGQSSKTYCYASPIRDEVAGIERV